MSINNGTRNVGIFDKKLKILNESKNKIKFYYFHNCVRFLKISPS